MSVINRLLLAALATACLVRPAFAGPPSARALALWTRCVAAAERRISRERHIERARNTGGRADSGPVVAPVDPDPACQPENPGTATVQQWRGTIVVRQVTVHDVVASLLRDAPRQDDVVRSRILSRTPDSVRVYLRVERRAVVTVTYDTEHDMTFAFDGGAASARSVMTKVVEVEDAGTPKERPRDDDRGFLWRLNSYFRYSPVADGIRIDVESLTLSRGIPLLLRPFVGPVIADIAKGSLTRTLEGIAERFHERQ